jgi:hypothetical protein
MEVSTELLQHMATFIADSTSMLEKAAEVDTAEKQRIVKIAEKVTPLVDQLIDAKLLDGGKRAQALQNMRDPLVLMEMVEKMAQMLAAPSPPSMGRSSDEKQVKTASRDEAVKESDLAYHRRLGF